MAKQVGAESTCSCTQLRHLDDLLKNKLNIQWNLSWYEDWKPRNRESTSQQAVRRLFLQVEGEIPCIWHLQPWRAWSEIIALWHPPFQGQRIPRPKLGATSIHKVGEIQAIPTHTVSSMPIAAVANDNQESDREREPICSWVRWRRLARASCDCERLLTFWRGGMYGKPDSDSVLQWECPERTFNGELRRAGQGPCTKLPCHQGERIESTACFQFVQLGRLTRKVQIRGFLGPSLAQLAGRRLCRVGSEGLSLFWGQWAGYRKDRSCAPEIIWNQGEPPSLGKIELLGRRLHSAPICCRSRGDLQNRQVRLKNNAGCVSARKRQQEKLLKGPFWISLRETKYTGS